MVIGIDLGTTNSAISYIDEEGNPQIIANRDGERTTPSVILFDDNIPLVGSVAKDNSVSDPLNVVQFAKRQMGNENFKYLKEDGEEYTPEELSSIIIKKLKEDAEEALGKEVKDGVITVPAYFDDAQRKATQDAGKIAGLNVLKVINEPTAAALAYGITKESENKNVMVYDLGGGTFDVTIMNFNDNHITVKATSGDRNLGGFDFDNKIIEFVEEEFKKEHKVDLSDDDVALQELRIKTEACKKTLSTRSKGMINISSEGKRLKVDITRDQFDEMIEPLINRTVFIMTTVLEDAHMTWDDIDKILLVGGSTRVSKVQEIIEKESGKKPSSEVNPDEVVSIGAALQADILSKEGAGMLVDTKITDVNSHSLGTLTLDSNTNKIYNSIILKKNSPLPGKSKKQYYTVDDNQSRLKLEITEGEDEDPEYVRIIGETTLELTPRPAGSPIEVVVGYDENSIIHVNVIDLVSNEDLGEMNINRSSNLTDSAIKEKTDKISTLEIE